MRMSRMLTERMRELREQIRSDRAIKSVADVDPADVPSGAILLPTGQVPTVVAIDEIEEVRQVAPNNLNLRGRVIMRDGTVHYVPDAKVVFEDLRRAKQARRGVAC